MADTEDQTSLIKDGQYPESKAFGVSIRAWIALFVVWTICAMSVMGILVAEPLYTLGGMVVAFYFGGANKQKQ